MKKIFIAFVLISSFFFFSCGKNYKIDQYGCFVKFSDAKLEAQKKNLPIFAIFTDESEQAKGSLFFLNTIFSTKEFQKYSKNKFVFYRMDCSSQTFEKSALRDDYSEKEREEAIFYAEAIEEGWMEMAILGLNYTPFFAFITPQGYVVNEIDYESDSMDVKTFCTILDYYLQQVDIVNHLVKQINTANTDREKYSAIESLFSTTPVQYRSSLIDLARTAVEINKDNQFGRVGQFVFAVAEEDAAELYTMNNDIEGAINKYLEAAKNPYLDSSEVVACYYRAAYVLQKDGKIDDPRIVEFLQEALKYNPTQEIKDSINDSIEFFTNSIKTGNE